MEVTDYVSYELAVKLKACGFDEPCDHYYDIEDAPYGCYWEGTSLYKKNYNEDIPKFSTPTLWQAQKWLRNTHKIDLNVDLDDDTDEPYVVEIYKDKECVCGHWELGFFVDYEQALSAGITKALELIRKGE